MEDKELEKVEKFENFSSSSGTIITISLSSPCHSETAHTRLEAEARRGRGNVAVRSDKNKEQKPAELHPRDFPERDRTSTAPAREYQPSPICYRAECARKRCRKRPLNERRNTTTGSSQPILRADPHRDGLPSILIFDRSAPSFALLPTEPRSYPGLSYD